MSDSESSPEQSGAHHYKLRRLSPEQRNLAKSTHKRYSEQPIQKLKETQEELDRKKGILNALTLIANEQRKTIELQNRQLTHDSHITDLLNMKGFEEVISPSINLCARTNSQMTFAFVDMDELKEVNDRKGHKAGDEVIGLLGGILKKHFSREVDIIGLNHPKEEGNPQAGLARRGGDEFILAIPLTSEEDVSEFLKAAREEFELSVKEIVGDISPSFSFGTAKLREKLVDRYDKDEIKSEVKEVTTIKAEDALPEYLLVSALGVAEMRMYQDKRERGREVR